MPPRVVLIGPPGSGKTSTATVLAARLGLLPRDTDADVEQSAGTSVADIFVEHGEARFRTMERTAVSTALRDHDGVLAVGGGAVLDEQTRDALAGLTVVFLDVSVKHAAARIGLNRDRPLLLGNPRAQWIRLMEARRPVYEQLATVRVDTDGKTPEEVADEVIAAVST